MSENNNDVVIEVDGTLWPVEEIMSRLENRIRALNNLGFTEEKKGEMYMKKKDVALVDLTKTGEASFSTVYFYHGLEMPIARYAVTKIASMLDKARLANSIKWTDPPTTSAFEIDYNQQAKVYNDVMLSSDEGLISAVTFMDPPTYRVELFAHTEEQLNNLKNKYLTCLEDANFYRGKCVKFTRNEVSFMQRPQRTFANIVLNDKIMNEYKTTVLEFLMNPEMQEICKKRRVLLYGPPGTGKTSLVAATFNYLSQSNVTCISLNDIDSMHLSIEEIFSFIMKFLAPAFIVFEDIDLLGFDRNSGMNPLIGRLLALFDGIEESEKAIVFCSTTNRFDVLDKAFTRPCRVDRKFQIDCLTDVELDKLFQLLLQVNAPDILKGKKLTGSHVQEISDTAKLLAKKNSGNPAEHVKEATEIVLEHFYLSTSNAKVGFGPSFVNEDSPHMEAKQIDTGRTPWERYRPEDPSQR